jgi:hypothetical protein
MTRKKISETESGITVGTVDLLSSPPVRRKLIYMEDIHILACGDGKN